MDVDPRLNEIKDCLYRVAAKALIVCDKKVLIVRDQVDDEWAFPGGGIDHGERVTEALLRELSEEVALEKDAVVSLPKIVTIATGHEKKHIPRANVYYEVVVDRSSSVSQGDDVYEMKWVDLANLKTTIFDSSVGDTTEVIAYLQDRLS